MKQTSLSKDKSSFKWDFQTIGGVTRVRIDSGQAIAHLDELDQKLWTALSCPIADLALDSETSSQLSQGDGKIHVSEVVATAKRLCRILRSPDDLLKKDDFVAIDAFQPDNEEGKQLQEAAHKVLEILGLSNATSVSLKNVQDSLASFAKTQFNGDGVITLGSTSDESLQAVISDCMNCVGSTPDRSGENGISQALLDEFFTALADYAAWQKMGDETALPYGDQSEAALKLFQDLKDKVADYFMRCKLAAFNPSSESSLDATSERIAAIACKDLSTCHDDIAQYPLARIHTEAVLPLQSDINPAWQSKICALKTLFIDTDYPGTDTLDETQWQAIQTKLSAYTAWKAAAKGEKVASLGMERVLELLASDSKAALTALIDRDRESDKNVESIRQLGKFICLYRDFYALLCNFVSFNDLYNRQLRALFQAGTLYIDQRSCDLCIRVNDLAKSVAMAAHSGMYVLYCDCTAKHSPTKMTIAAVVTNGDINQLMVGKNAIFYDREGRHWDACIVKIIDNPISIRQAFYSPYRKLSKVIEDTINKFAAEKDAKIMKEASGKITAAPAADPKAADTKNAPFDIGKFAGIFAAIGMAVGALGTALATILTKFVELRWWQVLLVFAIILLTISGPSMLMAWMKLRKRDLSPLLNGNGWAMNAKVLINMSFGATLTRLADVPKIALNTDPFAARKGGRCKRWLLSLVALVVLAVGGLYFTGTLNRWGLPLCGKTPTEQSCPSDTTQTMGDSLVVQPI